ncbi:MAG: AAA family ATPase [Lachnospiraceae bacterium]|nr:AAA family ATPase [Lachnospiraceae bacterium]
MNIEQAKEYIKDSVKIYLKKDDYGEYRIPVVRQRPIFLLGAPGIGKTAIMEQIASELSIALVSYSMSHHTRQSALGLPFIKHKTYEGMEYDVSEYTMSEIIASIYEIMDESEIKEGILFLDEINCVSETLAPSMLQFLQYKTFGRHKIPEGWVIVTAGNPPEYNKSVREFDVVTLDRLKVINVEADYPTWKKYALEKGIHSSIISFLDINRDYFYYMETTVKGRMYITARGWEDLSEVIYMYEEDGIKVSEELIEQYIRNDTVVKEFAAYYDLFNKYKKDYMVYELLDVKASEDAVEKAKKADIDERVSLLGMLLDIVLNDIKMCMDTVDYLSELLVMLKALKEKDGRYEFLAAMKNNKKNTFDKRVKANSIDIKEKSKSRRIIEFLSCALEEISKSGIIDDENVFGIVKERYDSEVSDMRKLSEKAKERLHNLFVFTEKAFEEGNEMLVLITELTAGKASSSFISMFGCEDYDKYNSKLMLSDRQNNLKKEIENVVFDTAL